MKMNPKILFVFLVMVFGLVFGIGGRAALAQNDSAGGPELKIAQTTFKAGAVEPGATVSHDFVVENIGDQELKILQVVAGCGCSVADFDKTIPPGVKGRVTITVTYDPDWAGETIEQSALMETNDSQAKYVNLIISAEVKPGK